MKKELLKLKVMLEKANIPFEIYQTSVYEAFNCYELIVNIKTDTISAISYYGGIYNSDLLDIIGGVTEEEYAVSDTLNDLTADEVFKRFKYCYENNTIFYKKPIIMKGKE